MSPEAGIAVRGKPYTLQCNSALPNVTYRWMYNNRYLDLVNDSRRRILPNGSLFFKSVRNPFWIYSASHYLLSLEVRRGFWTLCFFLKLLQISCVLKQIHYNIIIEDYHHNSQYLNFH